MQQAKSYNLHAATMLRDDYPHSAGPSLCAIPDAHPLISRIGNLELHLRGHLSSGAFVLDDLICRHLQIHPLLSEGAVIAVQ